MEDGAEQVDRLLAEALQHTQRAQATWQALSGDGSWKGRPEALELAQLTQAFSSHAQQLEATLDLLAQPSPLDQDAPDQRQRRSKRKERATTPDAAEALAALQGPMGGEDGAGAGDEAGDFPSLLAEPRELDSTDDEEKPAAEDPLAHIPMTAFPLDYEAPERTEERGGREDRGAWAAMGEEADLAELKKCNCKKSRCLKLYCECFSSGVFCEGACQCRDCLNVVQFTTLVTETRQHILDRSPNAFAPKVSSAGGHKKGCHCKKSRCLKKYCECYQANVPCTDSCKCENCKNTGPGAGAARDESPQESSFFEQGAPPLTSLQNCMAARQGKGTERRRKGGLPGRQTPARSAPSARVCPPAAEQQLPRPHHWQQQASQPAGSGRRSLSALVPGRHFLSRMGRAGSQPQPLSQEAFPSALNIQHWAPPAEGCLGSAPHQELALAEPGAGFAADAAVKVSFGEQQLAADGMAEAWRVARGQTLVLDTRRGWAPLGPASGGSAASHGYPCPRAGQPPLHGDGTGVPQSTATAGTAGTADTADDAISPPPQQPLAARAKRLTTAAIAEGYAVRASLGQPEAAAAEAAQQQQQRPVSWGTAPAAPEEQRDLRWAAVRRRDASERGPRAALSEPAAEPPVTMQWESPELSVQQQQQQQQGQPLQQQGQPQQEQQQPAFAGTPLPLQPAAADVLAEAQTNAGLCARAAQAKGLPSLAATPPAAGGHEEPRKAGKENARVVHWPKRPPPAEQAPAAEQPAPLAPWAQ